MYRKINKQKIPQTLYKYCPPERWGKVFEDWTIRFSPLSALNDPFECKPHVSYRIGYTSFCEGNKFCYEMIKNIYHKKTLCSFIFIVGALVFLSIFPVYFCVVFVLLCILIFLVSYTVMAIFDGVVKNIGPSIARSVCGAISMTTVNNSILMWSHYANSHLGFVLEIDTQNELFDINRYAFSRFEPVKYSWFRLAAGSREKHMDYMFYKGKIWKYEHEWRIAISLLKQACPENFHTDGVTTLPKKAIKGIIFGAAMEEEEMINKCKCIHTQEGCQHIEFKRVRLHNSRYRLVIEKIPDSLYK